MQYCNIARPRPCFDRIPALLVRPSFPPLFHTSFLPPLQSPLRPQKPLPSTRPYEIANSYIQNPQLVYTCLHFRIYVQHYR